MREKINLIGENGAFACFPVERAFMLEFKDYSKTYPGGKRAVSHLSLRIEEGDIYGFIGPNGAGKTTALSAAVGVLNFIEGDIFINGISIKENPVVCKRISAYIPDNPDIYEYLTGIQYINFIADIYGVEQKVRSERLNYYATAFEMQNRLSELISTYSHGMKQKVTLIAALIHDPKLLVLDEPFVGLDPKASHTLKGIFKTMCENGGAIFFSTHVLEVAEKLCNKVAIIMDGKLIASGSTNDVVGNSSLEKVFMELIEK